MLPRKPDSMRGLNPDLLPDRMDANRHSKKEGLDGEWTDLQRKRNETARELVHLRRNYLTENTEIEQRMAEYKETHPEIYALMKNVRDRGRTNYEAAHAKIAEVLYAELEDQYQAIPLTAEEIERDLDTERLSVMPLKQYIELLRKLPPRFFTHVTRQGVRDSGSFHYGGIGEFQRGFDEILKSGSVVSVYDRVLEDGITRATVGDLLKRLKLTPEHEPDKAEALRKLESELTRSDVAPISSYFADMKSIHTALEMVADRNYGGENGNEVFMIWPTALVAKEYHVGTQLLEVPDQFDPDETHKSSQFNDYWLLRKDDNTGTLPLDAGITFLPARAQVHPETGSQYETTAEGDPIPNPEIKLFEELLRSQNFQNISNQLREYIVAKESVARFDEKAAKEKESSSYSSLYVPEWEKQEQLRYQKELEAATPARMVYAQLCAEAGITNPRIFSIPDQGFLAQQHLSTLESLAMRPTLDEYAKLDRQTALGNLGIRFALAKETISSRDYWEDMFKRTGKKPSKVIFYDQRDPTMALDAFKRVAGIDRSSSEIDLKKLYEGNLIGQDGIKNVLSRESELVWQVGQEVIEEMYAAQKPVAKRRKKKSRDDSKVKQE